jgi:hypothetical protein
MEDCCKVSPRALSGVRADGTARRADHPQALLRSSALAPLGAAKTVPSFTEAAAALATSHQNVEHVGRLGLREQQQAAGEERERSSTRAPGR